MLDKEHFKDLLNYILVIGIFVLAFFIIKPIIYSIIFGVLIAYILYPLYKFLLKRTKSKNLSAFLICIGLLVILIIITGIILGSLMNQVVGLYLKFQQIDTDEVIKTSLPEFIASSEVSTNIVNGIESSISKLLAKFASAIGDFVLNLPGYLLQILVVFIILFFSLRDGEKAFEYFKSLSPFSKDIQDKFFKHFQDITHSVLVGQVVIGIIQGIIAGIGYFIFGVPNALLLTILTIIIGIIPIIGPWFVWIPVDIYLFVVGRTGAGIGLLIYGLFLINWIDTILRPLIVSRKTQINPAIVLIGMIGGLFFFGVLGLIIGPLILAYVILVLELYRKQKFSETLIFKKMDDYKRF